jgi:hypothetical protein
MNCSKTLVLFFVLAFATTFVAAVDVSPPSVCATDCDSLLNAVISCKPNSGMSDLPASASEVGTCVCPAFAESSTDMCLICLQNNGLSSSSSANLINELKTDCLSKDSSKVKEAILTIYKNPSLLKRSDAARASVSLLLAIVPVIATLLFA